MIKTQAAPMPTSPCPADPTHVDLSNPVQCAYWTKYFATTEKRLREAVSLMGPSVIGVRAFLRKFS